MVDESIFKAGDICGQSYRIVRLLMRNAWIEKYLVKREDTQHTAILTCSRFNHIAGDPPSLELFKSNAERIRSAPMIEMPKVYDFGVQGGVYWIATQYIDAPNIVTLNKQARPKDTPEWRALDAASMACTAGYVLGDMVNYGLLHGHLGPEHIVIDGLPFDMNVFLLDAGFADLFQFNGVAARHYLRYCAPELLEGKVIDERADIYSIGMILYHFMAQHPPYWDKIKIEHDPALIPMVLEQSPTDLRKLVYCPEPLWDLIEQATQKDPNKRFKTIDDFYEMAQLAINKIENEPRILALGEQVRKEAEAKNRAAVPLITAKPRKEGDSPTTVPRGPNTDMQRRAAWLAALQNAALPRIAPEQARRESEPPLEVREPEPQSKKPASVVAEISAKARDETEEPITSRSPVGTQEVSENAREMPEASVTSSPERKPAKGRAWLRNAWGWTAFAGVIAASILGAVHTGASIHAPTSDNSRPLVSIEVVANEPAKEADALKPPACAPPNACMMVSPAPCAMCEPQKSSQDVDIPSRKRGKSSPAQEPAKAPQARTDCPYGVMFCVVPQ